MDLGATDRDDVPRQPDDRPLLNDRGLLNERGLLNDRELLKLRDDEERGALLRPKKWENPLLRDEEWDDEWDDDEPLRVPEW